MTSMRNILIEIQNSQAFERLEPFKQNAVWKSLSHEDRLLLAQLLVDQGAQQLTQGDTQVLDSFIAANQISSNSPEILYQQGTIFSAYCDNFSILNLASQALTCATHQDPLYFKAWYLHAQVLTAMGLHEGKADYFTEALENFETAYAFLDVLVETFPKKEFYWKWGFCLASLGKISGEPLDFHEAIVKYRLAYEEGCQETQFLTDFGHSYADLAALLEKVEYFTEALHLFNQVVLRDETLFEGWYNQASCLHRLLEFGHQDQLSEQAEKSFAKAAELNPAHSQVWFKWGQVQLFIGKLKRDQQKLEGSLNKFSQAHQLEPNQPEILKSWAEVELFLGAQEERLDLLHAARTKILQSLEIQPDDSHVWYLYGSCLNELGRYFEEEDYYHQAIEKFQYGLSLTRQEPLLWYGMALAHFALGELTEEQVLFEKAVRYCARVMEFGGGECAQFWNDWGISLMKLAELTQDVSHVEQAIEKFERALKQPIQNLEEEDVDLEWVYNYGSAYDLLGDLTEESCHFERAVQILNQVVQLDPDYHQARYALALALSHLGEASFDTEMYDKAVEHFEFILEQDPEDDMIHLDFGMTLTNLALLVHDIHHPERSQALYRQAESHLMQSATLGNIQSFYQLAGLYSITGHYDHAMYYIERAQFFGTLPKIEDLLHDEWLDELRKIPAFRQFINELSSQQSMDDK